MTAVAMLCPGQFQGVDVSDDSHMRVDADHAFPIRGAQIQGSNLILDRCHCGTEGNRFSFASYLPEHPIRREGNVGRNIAFRHTSRLYLRCVVRLHFLVFN